ncbi:MAG: hypothetical protein H0X62_02835 [Bacteroidetes bacterium]|nr:hypothetical protein [Bacteroidota bacterium]
MRKTMLKREKIIESLKKLPEQVSLDEVLDRIILLDKIETGLEQSEKGQITPDDQLDEKLPEWLK